MRRLALSGSQPHPPHPDDGWHAIASTAAVPRAEAEETGSEPWRHPWLVPVTAVTLPASAIKASARQRSHKCHKTPSPAVLSITAEVRARQRRAR